MALISSKVNYPWIFLKLFLNWCMVNLHFTSHCVMARIKSANFRFFSFSMLSSYDISSILLLLRFRNAELPVMVALGLMEMVEMVLGLMGVLVMERLFFRLCCVWGDRSCGCYCAMRER